MACKSKGIEKQQFYWLDLHITGFQLIFTFLPVFRCARNTSFIMDLYNIKTLCASVQLCIAMRTKCMSEFFSSSFQFNSMPMLNIHLLLATKWVSEMASDSIEVLLWHLRISRVRATAARPSTIPTAWKHTMHDYIFIHIYTNANTYNHMSAHLYLPKQIIKRKASRWCTNARVHPYQCKCVSVFL